MRVPPKATRNPVEVKLWRRTVSASRRNEERWGLRPPCACHKGPRPDLGIIHHPKTCPGFTDKRTLRDEVRHEAVARERHTVHHVVVHACEQRDALLGPLAGPVAFGLPPRKVLQRRLTALVSVLAHGHGRHGRQSLAGPSPRLSLCKPPPPPTEKKTTEPSRQSLDNGCERWRGQQHGGEGQRRVGPI